MLEWQPIETYKKTRGNSDEMVVLASFHQYEQEDGQMSEPDLRWMAVGCWFDGWQARSGAQLGVCPGNDWLALKEPTHWAPLPDGTPDF